MAVKACAFIADAALFAVGLKLDISITDISGNVAQIQYGPVSPDIAEITLNSDIRATVKEYAINNWGTTFDVLDTVRLIHRISE